MKLPQDGPRDHAFEHRLPAGPFEYRIDVGWGDADPAQIAYTANIPGWGLRAIEQWVKACIGAGWYELNLDFGVGTPFVELNCRFLAPITPRHPLDLRVTLAHLGRTSMVCQVAGFQSDADTRRHCFDGRYACVFADAVRLRPVPIPPRMRANLRRFAERQGSPFEDALAAGAAHPVTET